MSLVLGMAFTNKAIIISDGRARSAKSNSIIDESCDKTREINKNVVIGFSGNLEFSLWLLEQFENFCKQKVTQLKADHIAKIFCEIAKLEMDYLKKLDASNTLNFQMIVAGINSKKVMSLCSFGVPTNFEIREYIPTTQNFIYSILYPENSEFSFDFEKIMKAQPGKELECYVGMLFSEASKMDDSINTNLFIKSIEL